MNRNLSLAVVLVLGAGCGLLQPHRDRQISSLREPSYSTILSPGEVVMDPLNLVGDEFAVPEQFRNRVMFWMEVFTTYDDDTYLVHDALFPEVVFSKGDIRSFMKNKTPEAAILADAKSKIRQEMRKKNNSVLLSSWKQAYAQAGVKLPDRELKKALERLRVQKGLKDSFLNGVRRAEPYLPEMERIFVKHKLPAELTRLGFVESNFNPYSISYAGAKGVWQIMMYPGKSILKIEGQIDERDDPLTSTHAAAQLLKHSFRATKSWPLTIVSYNQGLPEIMRMRRKYGKDKDVYKMITQHASKQYKFSGQNYYWEFLAALYAEKYFSRLVADARL